MEFNLNFPTQNSQNSQLQIEVGETLFVLGVNGSGKSSLMHRFANQNPGRVRKITAHRQTWIKSDTLDMTPSAKVQTEQDIIYLDQQQDSRYRESFAAERASLTIF